MPYKGKAKGDFKELGRIKITDSSELILSEISEGKVIKGLNIGKFVTSERYTGFAPGGNFIPGDMVIDFLTLFSREDLELALDAKDKSIGKEINEYLKPS